MEEFSQQLGGNLWGGLMSPSSPAAKASGDTATVAMVAPHTRGASAFDKGHCIPSSSLLSNNNNNQNSPGASSSHFPPSNADAIKAKIISHPQYSSVLAAYIDCQKVGAPPEVVARLSAVAQEQRASLICRDAPTDPELDQFMEANREMLVKYKEELTRPLQEAMEFLRRVESQLNFLSLTHGSVRISSAEPRCTYCRMSEGELRASLRGESPPSRKAEEKFGVCSSKDDLDGSGEETELPDLDASAEDRELKHHLLKKYSGYLSSLRQELSKKKKKGKLPKDAGQQLLNWWEMHYKWPYPSETQKVALAESTGLDLKQINNWFINQRKRHWKPAQDCMQFVVMDGLHAPSAALYMEGQYFMADGLYRLGP